MLLPDTQRLLKANAVRELGTRVAFNFDDLHKQGATYLQQIQQQAAELIQQAQQEAEAIREAARKSAFDTGRREGLADAGQQIETQVQRVVEQQLGERLQTTLPAISAIAQAMQQGLDDWCIRWETAAVELSVALTEKLVHRTIECQPQVVTGMISEVLRVAAGHPQLRVHLHPDDIQHLGEHADDVVKSISACAEAVLLPDASVGRGGCRIETRHGEIDARLDTMLQRIAEELLS